MRKILVTSLFLCTSAWATWNNPTVISASRDSNGNSIVALKFTNTDGRVYAVNDFIPFGASGTQLGDFVATTLNNLNAQDVAFASAPASGFTVAPTVQPGPTVNLFAIQEAQLTSDIQLLRQYKEAINLGLITTSDANYVATLSSATNHFAAIESTATSTGIIPPSP